MKSQAKYDSFCLQERCFRDKNAFFRFKDQNVHVKEGHETVFIHEASFSRFFKSQFNNHSNMSFHNLYSHLLRIKEIIDKTMKEITEILMAYIFASCIESAESEIKSLSYLNSQNFINGMKGGEYQCLRMLKMFYRGELNQSIDIIGLKNKELSGILLFIEQAKEDIKQWIITYKANKFQQIEAELQEQPSQNHQYMLKQEQFQQQLKNFKEREENIKLQDDPYYRLTKLDSKNQSMISKGIQSDFMSVEEDSDSDEENSEGNQPSKTKMIVKSDMQEKKKRKRRPCLQKIRNFHGNEIAILQSFTPFKTFKTIKESYPNATIFHIFDKNFLSGNSIKQLFYRDRVDKLTINTFLNSKILAKFPVEKIRRLKRLCLNWDLQHFQRLYFREKYFRRKDHLDFYQQKALQIASEVIKETPLNEHLWLFARQHDDKNYIANRIHSNLTSCEVTLNIIRKLSLLTTLRHLKINKLLACQHKLTPQAADKNISALIGQNKQLNSVFLNDLQIKVLEQQGKQRHHLQLSYLKDTFLQLGELTNLLHFSLINQSKKPMVILARRISQLKKLKVLNLHCIAFLAEKQRQIQETDNLLSTFSDLEHLGLYACPQIKSKQLSKLPVSCLVKLKYLNLGKTNAGEPCIKLLAQMKQLLILNIEQTLITGKDLIQMLKEYLMEFKRPHPLTHLNIKTKLFQWKARGLRKLTPEDRKQAEKETNPYLSLIKDIQEREHEIKIMTKTAKYKKSREEALNSSGPSYNKMLLIQFKRQNQFKRLSARDKAQILYYRHPFTVEDLRSIANYLPNLEYLNIAYHYELATADFSCFRSLRTLAKDRHIDSTYIKLPPNATLYEEKDEFEAHHSPSKTLI